MNGDHNSRGNGQEGDGPTTEHTDDSEEERLAEDLDRLATRVASDLRGLAAVVRDGESPATEDVEAALSDLRRSDEMVRRRLTEAEGPDLSRDQRDPRTRDVKKSDLADVTDIEELREAPAEEVAHRLASDVHELRNVADRVDRKLYAEDLTDHEAGELWRAGARIASWGRDVLVLRADRDVLLTREEAEAFDDSAVEGGEDA